MRYFIALWLLMAAVAAPFSSAQAQAPAQGRVVSACGTPGITYTIGGFGPVTIDTTGEICTSGGGGGGGGTSSAFNAAFPATGTAVGMSQGGNMVPFTGTSNNLNVQCANCSGSGVSTVDGATFTATTSLFAGGGGFFQTTATNNPLTDGKQGMFQVTANRALFTNLRNASGAEIGVAAAPVQVSLANTGSNGTAVLVTGTGGTFPLPTGAATAANQATEISSLATIATNTGLSVPTTQSGVTTALISCDNHVFKHITSATDTLAVQGVSAKVVYVCGWRARAAGVATWFLENTASTNANCSSSNTQITGVATEAANTGEVMNPAFWSGLKNTAGNGLCINSTGTGGVDVDIFYTQF